MRLDYWNDPLVVSAFRVRFRGGAPTFIAATYFMILVALGGILHYALASDPNYSWLNVYCVALLSIETVVAGVLAAMGTHQSMYAEITSRTLDYQRIAAVPPRDILLGKLLGEPAQGYLMVLAGFPLLAWCWGMGAVTAGTLLLLVVQIITTAFLLGSVGLIYPLDANADGKVSAGRLIKMVVGVLAFIYSAPVAIMAPFMTHNPLAQIPIGFLTPVLGIVGLGRGTPAVDCLPWFGVRIPYLGITPITQIVVGAIIIHSIARRMISPVNVALSKPTAYAIVAALDVIVAGVLMDSATMASTVDISVATFTAIHIGLSLAMIFAITPGRECLRSWIWRFRGRRPLGRDLWLGERSENVLALLTLCALGIVTAICLVIIPNGMRNAPNVGIVSLIGSQIDKLAALCLLILAFGTLFQLMVSLGPAMPMFFFMIVATLVVAPHLAGIYLEIPELAAMSPSAQFAHWIINDPPLLPLWPFFVTYTALLLFSRVVLSRRLRLTVAVVDRTIARLQAGDAALT